MFMKNAPLSKKQLKAAKKLVKKQPRNEHPFTSEHYKALPKGGN
jgi:hypothetical protein